MPASPHQELGSIAAGTIEPAPRVASGEITQERVDELYERLQTSKYYVATGQEFGPNAAGGTFSLVIADALTGNRFRQNGEGAKQHAKNLYAFLLEHHNDVEGRKIIPRVCIDGRQGENKNTTVVGGHDSDHGADDCGAQKRLLDIVRYMAHRGDDVRTFLQSHGVAVDDATHALLVENTQALIDGHYVTSPIALREAYVETAGETSVTRLIGAHAEVVATLNTETSMTLDRAAIRREFGSQYEAFNVDIDALQQSSALIALNARTTSQTFIAALYYNVATTAVLCGPSLLIVDR